MCLKLGDADEGGGTGDCLVGVCSALANDARPR